MGPASLRTAGLMEALVELGLHVEDRRDVAPGTTVHLDGTAETQRAACASWIEPLAMAAYAAAKSGLPIFLGGDHLMAAGTVTGTAKAARERGQEPFVLWLDAHPDLHDLSSTATGNLHGTPVAYFTGHAVRPTLPRSCGNRSTRECVHDRTSFRGHGGADNSRRKRQW